MSARRPTTLVVTEATLGAAEVERVLQPRDGLVLERRASETGAFEAAHGPFERYRREVRTEALPDGRYRVHQTVEYRVVVPFFGWLFAPALRRHVGRPVVGPAPWWSPPQRIDALAARALGTLCAIAVVTGYLGTILSQTITFVADDFDAGKGAQGVALAFVRADVIITVVVVAAADRKGRRSAALMAGAVGCGLTALGALAPSLPLLTASQVVARGFVTTTAVLLGIISAEEMPAGSRAYAVSLLAMAGALGAGVCVALLPLADVGSSGWRLVFAFALAGLPLLSRAGRLLPESRRFRAPHTTVPMAGHGRRFWLLAASGLLFNLFLAPASQFANEYLRTERGFSGGRIALFTILTNTPGAIGIVVGGRLAERGRRLVGAVGIVGGVAATVLMYQSQGWPLWSFSVVGAVIGAATVPALGVYGPELFPTSLRGRANGIVTVLARAGSVVGLLAAGFLSDAWGELGPVMALLSIGPALLAILVVTAYPETAHRELEELNPEDALPAGEAARDP